MYITVIYHATYLTVL